MSAPQVTRTVTVMRIKDMTTRLQQMRTLLRRDAVTRAKLIEPVRVTKARALVDAFDRQQESAEEGARKQIDAEINAVRLAVVYKDVDVSLPMVEALEARVKKVKL